MNRQSKREKRLLRSGVIAISLILSLGFARPLRSQTRPEPKRSRAIQQALAEMVANGEAPGMIAAIASSAGVIAIAAAGVRKVGTDIAVTCDDLVHLGSCSKAMTATMVATLVAEGKLDWEMKLIDAIPELTQAIHRDYHPITLWQLLTHRAGVPANPADWEAHRTKEIRERRLAILKDNLGTPPASRAGEFHYSNFGYMIAACMAERIGGASWESLMKKRLFAPLGMRSAGFGAPHAPGRTDQPWGHQRIGAQWRPSDSYDAEALGPAGEIHCTVADWAKFLSLQLANPNPVLERKYLQKLIEPVGFYAGGWGVVERPWAKGAMLTHNGSNGIWFATVVVAPKLDRAFVVVTNSRDFATTGDTCGKMIAELVKINRGNDL